MESGRDSGCCESNDRKNVSLRKLLRLGRCPECRLWVKLRRTQYEHMFSALPSNSDIARRGRHVSNVPLPDSSTAAIASQFTSRVGVAPQWQPISRPAYSRHACPEMVVVTVRISTPRSREEREALRDVPPEAESR